MDLHFFIPQFLYFCLLGIAFPFLFWLLICYRKAIKEKWNLSPSLLRYFSQRSNVLFGIRSALLSIAWVLACIAFASPAQKEKSQEAHAFPSLDSSRLDKSIITLPPHEVVFIFDVSSSMAAIDGGKAISRIERAKKIAVELLHGLPGNITSLYAMGSTLECVCPPTYDLNFMGIQINMIEVDPGDGTHFLPVLEALSERYINKGFNQNTSFVFFSDGEDDPQKSLALSDAEKKKRLENLLRRFPKDRVNWFFICLGDSVGIEIPRDMLQGKKIISRRNDSFLKELAESVDAPVFIASAMLDSEIGDGFSERWKEFKMKDISSLDFRSLSVRTSEDQAAYELLYQWPLTVACLFLLTALWLPQEDLHQKKRFD